MSLAPVRAYAFDSRFSVPNFQAGRYVRTKSMYPLWNGVVLKNAMYRSVKMGSLRKVLCTHAQICFHKWSDSVTTQASTLSWPSSITPRKLGETLCFHCATYWWPGNFNSHWRTSEKVLRCETILWWTMSWSLLPATATPQRNNASEDTCASPWSRKTLSTKEAQTRGNSHGVSNSWRRQHGAIAPYQQGLVEAAEELSILSRDSYNTAAL